MGAQRKEVTTQATPLTRDVLGIFQRGLRGGGGGAGVPITGGGGGRGLVGRTRREALALEQQRLGGLPADFGGIEVGLGPLSREAGTAARQFVASGGGRFDFGPLVESLEARQARATEEAVADLRESFGVAGARFGTPLARGEADLRTGLEADFNALLAELQFREHQARQQRLLQGIDLLSAIGGRNLAPLFQLALAGIQPDVFTEHPLVTGAGVLSGAAQGAGGLMTGIGA